LDAGHARCLRDGGPRFVKLQKLATIVAGKGLLAFSLVVVLTLLASQLFDPRWISEDRSVAA
jgi:uncharacterized paraquat-inducible protein A